MAVAKNTECKVVGSVPADQAAQLEEVLAGMAGREGQEFRVLEVALKSEGRPPRQLLLTSPMDREDVPGSSRSWVARIDPPLVRAAVRDLGVGVRSITEAPMRGISVLAFWESLGMCHAHECIKAGRTYSIDVQQETLQVRVCQLLKLGEKGKTGTAMELSPTHRLVEVTCRVADGDYVLGAEVIGKLGEQLKPMVHLQKC